MRRGLIYTAIRNKQVICFVILMIVVLGIYSYSTVPKQEYPDTSSPAVMVTVVYPGAAPEIMEEYVTKKIEEKALELEGYDYSTSFSQNSISSILIVFKMDLSSEDIEDAIDDLRRKVEDMKADLPKGIEEISISQFNLSDTAGMILAVTGPNYSYEELVSYSDEIKNELLHIKGIKRVDIIGDQEKEIKVDVDISKLNQYNLSLNDIVNLLNVQNIEIPSGNLDNEEYTINVNPKGIFKSIKDIQNVIVNVSQESGAIVTLKDIAHVYMGLKDSNFKIRHNGKSTILLCGYFAQEQNIVKTGKKVEAVLDDVKKELPSDLVIETITYQPKEVQNSIKDFTLNLIEGVIIVVIVIMLGMGIRNSVVVSLVIPLSVFMTFIVMGLLGIKIQMITIAGLIMALGMLVDNAIVVSDAIQVRLDSGESKLNACIEGTKEVAIPVLSSTLTTVAAFSPLLFLPRAAGEFAGGIPKMVITSLIASYIMALFITPTIAFMTFKANGKTSKPLKVRNYFSRLLNIGLLRRKTAVAIVITIFIFMLFVGSLLPMELYPKSNKNIFYIDVKTDYASNIDKTEEIVHSIEGILQKQDEIIGYTSSIGGVLPRFDISIPPQANFPNIAQLLVKADLKRSNRFGNNEEIVHYLQGLFDRSIVGADVNVKELGLTVVGAPVQIRITGENLDEIREAAGVVKNVIKDVKGTTNIEDDIENSEYQLDISIDPQRALAKGITNLDVQNELNIALMGREASVYREKGKEYGILVRGGIDSKGDLENLAVKSSITGSKTLLKDVADISMSSNLTTIKRYDGKRTVTISSEVKPGFNAVEIQTKIEKQLEKYDFKGIDIVFEGEKSELESDLGNLGIAALFAIFFIFVILMVQFSSVVQPFIILISVPFSIIGSILALLLFRQPLSLFGCLGIVSLIGVVVNNAIILIDYINTQREKGKTIKEACESAVEARFRPVILTTITTVLGLMPLAISNNELFRPMAISFMGGLLVSTLLTLVIIPVIYSIVEGVKENLLMSRNSKNA